VEIAPAVNASSVDDSEQHRKGDAPEPHDCKPKQAPPLCCFQSKHIPLTARPAGDILTEPERFPIRAGIVRRSFYFHVKVSIA
jgi:hypothetical protein